MDHEGDADPDSDNQLGTMSDDSLYAIYGLSQAPSNLTYYSETAGDASD